MNEIGGPNITLRMVFVTVIVVALIAVCGLIRALHEQGFNAADYQFKPWSTGLASYTSVQRHRKVRNDVAKRNKNMPKHFRLPKDSVLENLSDLTLSKVFWFYVNHIQARCMNIRSMSSTGYEKMICADDFHAPRKQDCLVYSVGYDLTFDFELQVQRTYNCEIHVIERQRLQNKTYTKQKRTVGNRAVDLPKGIKVQEMFNTDTGDEEKTRNTMFKMIRRAINSANRMIDVLQIDINGEEWNVLSRLLNSWTLKHVRQLLIEVHFGWGGVSKCEDLKILRRLYEAGFRISINKHKLTTDSVSHMPNLTLTNVNEITLINTKLKNSHRFF